MEPEKFKEILRPMATTIYGHMYQSDDSPYKNELDMVQHRARGAVIAATAICKELDKIYGNTEEE